LLIRFFSYNPCSSLWFITIFILIEIDFNLDDEPNDGPRQYIYLSGFYSIGLLNALDDVGIRIDTITSVSCDSLDETKQLFDEIIRRDRQEQSLKADVLKEIRT
jgi:hypothetical protein